MAVGKVQLWHHNKLVCLYYPESRQVRPGCCTMPLLDPRHPLHLLHTLGGGGGGSGVDGGGGVLFMGRPRAEGTCNPKLPTGLTKRAPQEKYHQRRVIVSLRLQFSWLPGSRARLESVGIFRLYNAVLP